MVTIRCPPRHSQGSTEFAVNEIKKFFVSDCAALSSPFFVYSENWGIAMAAKIPIIATTIINSMRVNPFCILLITFSH